MPSTAGGVSVSTMPAITGSLGSGCAPSASSRSRRSPGVEESPTTHVNSRRPRSRNQTRTSSAAASTFVSRNRSASPNQWCTPGALKRTYPSRSSRSNAGQSGVYAKGSSASFRAAFILPRPNGAQNVVPRSSGSCRELPPLASAPVRSPRGGRTLAASDAYHGTPSCCV